MIRLFIIIGIQALFSQQEHSKEFPNNYLGKWAGHIEIRDSKGKLMNVVDMHFSLVPLEEKRWIWLMEYPKHEPKLKKNYVLIQNNNSPRIFYIDEKNGIILDQIWTGNRLIGSYHLYGKIYNTVLSLMGDSLCFEIVIMKLPELSSEVQNLEMIQIHNATLKRVD
jgi:hypothetical protein